MSRQRKALHCRLGKDYDLLGLVLRKDLEFKRTMGLNIYSNLMVKHLYDLCVGARYLTPPLIFLSSFCNTKSVFIFF